MSETDYLRIKLENIEKDIRLIKSNMSFVQELEDRCSELEQENLCLKEKLNKLEEKQDCLVTEYNKNCDFDKRILI